MLQIPPVTQGLIIVVALCAGIYDIRYRRIPNWLVLPVLLIGFGLNAFLYGLQGLKYAGLGMGLAFLVYFPLYLLRGMGAGDVKLMAAIGALVGPQNWLVIFVATGILGLFFAGAIMLARGRVRKTLLNVGFILREMAHFRAPHLSSEELDLNNPKSVKLPHGAVIAVACFAVIGMTAM